MGAYGVSRAQRCGFGRGLAQKDYSANHPVRFREFYDS